MQQTQSVEPGLPIPVVITAYSDKSFTFIMKTTPASILAQKSSKIASKAHLYLIQIRLERLLELKQKKLQKLKMPDLTASDMDAAVKNCGRKCKKYGY